MTRLRGAKSQVLLLVLALVGIGDSIYLTAVHFQDAPLVCSASGLIDCARVLSSPFSFVPGTAIPISLPGLAWCILMAILAALGIWLRSEPRWLRPAEFGLTLLGMLTVLYLIYVELVRLHTICAWCTVLHALILVMFLVTLARLLQTGEEQEDLEAPSTSTKAPKLSRSRS